MALGWIGATTPFASHVKKLKRRCSISPSAFFRTPVQGRQMSANTNNGRLSSRANHTGVFIGLVSSYSVIWTVKVAPAVQSEAGPARSLRSAALALPPTEPYPLGPFEVVEHACPGADEDWDHADRAIAFEFCRTGRGGA